METLTSRERIRRILAREPVDRVGLFEHFWGDTFRKWTDEGHIKEGEDVDSHFGFDMRACWAFNFVADLDFEPVVLEEDDETVLTRDGNGAILRHHKQHASTPEHVDFTVKDRAGWEQLTKPILTADPRRINMQAYHDARKAAAERDLFFCWSGVNVFELMHPVCGHEYMLLGMAMDPDWIKEMTMTYARLTIELMEDLFAKEGKPDGIWFYEDMGFKERPFMSPDMYREIIQPAHKLTIDYCHSQGLPVILHSCGFVEPLLPGLVEAGIDCLQVMEVKAGMDCCRIKRNFGDRLALCGGMDVRHLTRNDIPGLKAELEAKMPVVMDGSGYILHSDHSIPDQVEYETYRTFVDYGLELGTYR